MPYSPLYEPYQSRRMSNGPSPAAASSHSGSPAPSNVATWSPYNSWCGNLPPTLCEVALYALLWLDTVALPKVGGPKASRADACSLLLRQPAASWRRVQAQRRQPIPMKAVLASASPPGTGRRGASAMEVLGPVVYAWLQHDRLLQSVDYAQAVAEAWRGVTLTPLQLFVYLDVAYSDRGKRGAKLRYDGSTCRWQHPQFVEAWQALLFDTPGVGEAMVQLLSLPLSVAQSLVFRSQAHELPQLMSPPRSPAGSTPTSPILASSPPPGLSQQAGADSAVAARPAVASRHRHEPLSAHQPPSVLPSAHAPAVPLALPDSLLSAEAQRRGMARSSASTRSPVAAISPTLQPHEAISWAERMRLSYLRATTKRGGVRASSAQQDTDVRKAWARDWCRTRLLSEALGTWQRTAKAHALRLTQQAFDEHIRGKLDEVRRARLALANEFYEDTARTSALHAWRATASPGAAALATPPRGSSHVHSERLSLPERGNHSDRASARHALICSSATDPALLRVDRTDDTPSARLSPKSRSSSPARNEQRDGYASSRSSESQVVAVTPAHRLSGIFDVVGQAVTGLVCGPLPSSPRPITKDGNPQLSFSAQQQQAPTPPPQQNGGGSVSGSGSGSGGSQEPLLGEDKEEDTRTPSSTQPLVPPGSPALPMPVEIAQELHLARSYVSDARDKAELVATVLEKLTAVLEQHGREDEGAEANASSGERRQTLRALSAIRAMQADAIRLLNEASAITAREETEAAAGVSRQATRQAAEAEVVAVANEEATRADNAAPPAAVIAPAPSAHSSDWERAPSVPLQYAAADLPSLLPTGAASDGEWRCVEHGAEINGTIPGRGGTK